MEKPDKDGSGYILSISYTSDEELDQIIYEEIYAEVDGDSETVWIATTIRALFSPS